MNMYEPKKEAQKDFNYIVMAPYPNDGMYLRRSLSFLVFEETYSMLLLTFAGSHLLTAVSRDRCWGKCHAPASRVCGCAEWTQQLEAESIVLRGPRRGGAALPADAAAAALDQALLMEGALDYSFPSSVHRVQSQQWGLNVSCYARLSLAC